MERREHGAHRCPFLACFERVVGYAPPFSPPRATPGSAFVGGEWRWRRN
uniref:Uncharacterized protein n=1 Tax=Arundo donax TaxID=35708 RepID=A0A0A9HNX8_ARUDO